MKGENNMELSKETLRKTKELLEKEISEIKKEESEYRKVLIEKSRIEGFEIHHIDYYGENHQSLNSVTFEESENNNLGSLRFNLELNKNYIDRYNWGGLSYSSIKPEEKDEDYKKSIAYITKVQIMLQLISEYTKIRKIADEAIESYKSTIYPLMQGRYEIERQIESIVKELNTINDNEIYEKALVFFKEEKWFVKFFNLTPRTRLSHCKLEVDKKENLILYFGFNLSEKKKIGKEILINLYRHAMKEFTSHDYRKDYTVKYYKYNNCYNTYEETQNYEKIEITKEEYEKIRYA